MRELTLALTRGRILRASLPLLRAAGIELDEGFADGRKLMLRAGGLRLLLLRGTDAATCVRHGAADLGLVGKDVILEHGSEGLCEMLDLGVARCRLAAAAMDGAPLPEGRLRVATKFVNVARRHYASQGRQADIIPLYGGIELAPSIGLSDCIVDLVDSGSTLRANGLVALEQIAAISARLVVNSAALKVRRKAVSAVVERVGSALGTQS